MKKQGNAGSLTPDEIQERFGKGKVEHFPTCTCGMVAKRDVQPWEHGQGCPCAWFPCAAYDDSGDWESTFGQARD